jgi:hypothetical protein
VSNFAQRGVANGDALAALAIVRALIKSLRKSGKLTTEELGSIVAAADAEIPRDNNDAKNEAHRLIQTFKD